MFLRWGRCRRAWSYAQEAEGKYDIAQLFLSSRAELNSRINRLLEVIEFDAILWICYPKGSSGVKTDLTRDTPWNVLTRKGIRAVAPVSADRVWSAMRFRPHEQVGRGGQHEMLRSPQAVLIKQKNPRGPE